MKKHSQIIIIEILLCASFLNLNCKKGNPVTPPDDTFALTVEDTSCTEVWLRIKIGSGNTNREVALKRDSIVLFTRPFNDLETVVIDTNLLPNHTYTYTASLTNCLIPASSTARTMDTTSHAWSFTTTLLGDGSGSSALYDVAIINDNLVFACGEVYYNGSICNLARWNGQQWDTMHISVTLTYTSSQIVTDQDPLKTIYAFNESDIWVVSQAGGVSHWNGTQWVMLAIPFNQGPGACNKTWGTSSSDIYFVGNNGRIIHYNGSTWTKLESGTTTIINDIYGIRNKRSNQDEAYCAVSDFFQPKDKKILRITNTTVIDSIPWNTGKDVFSVWSVTGTFLYACGNGVFENSSGFWKEVRLGYYTSCIRGSAVNNVFVVGDYGMIAHFNGNTWQTFFPVPNMGSYNGVAVTNNMMIAVGMIPNGQSTVVIGRQ